MSTPIPFPSLPFLPFDFSTTTYADTCCFGLRLYESSNTERFSRADSPETTETEETPNIEAIEMIGMAMKMKN